MMENRKFIPFENFGEIHFGENYLQVREKLNSPFSQVYFDENSKTFSDHFDELGFKIEYDTDNNVLSFETFNDMNFDFYFLDKNLTTMLFSEIETLLKSEDNSTEYFSIGIYSPKFGISICYENFQDEPDEQATSFHIIRKDYMELNK